MRQIVNLKLYVSVGIENPENETFDSQKFSRRIYSRKSNLKFKDHKFGGKTIMINWLQT